MKQAIFFLFSFFLAAGVFAQKVVNDPNAEPRTVSSFHAIHISNAFEVVLVQGNDEGLAVSAEDKADIPQIKTEVENGVLKIEFDQKNKWFSKNKKLKAYISLKNIDELRAGGASKISIDGSLHATTLKLALTGATDLSGKLNVSGELGIELSGASDVSLTGSAGSVNLVARGASDVKAYDFTSASCNIDASGASTVHITVDKELKAKLSGASSVSYKGNAVVTDIKTSGASSISRKS